jgi:hypothetical protein
MQAPWAQTSDVQRAVAHHQQLLAQATMSATAAHPVIAQQMHQQAQQMQQIHQQPAPVHVPLSSQPQHPFGMLAAGNPHLLPGQMQQIQQIQQMRMQQLQQQQYMQQQFVQMPQPAPRPAVLPAISVPAPAPAARPVSEEVEKEKEEGGEDDGPSVASSRARRETAGKPALPWGRRLWAGLHACR